MINTVSFVVLAALDLATLIYLLVRTRSWLMVFLFLSYVGMIYFFEYVILVCFHSYTYYPHILSDPYMDSMMGAFISNFLTVPTVGLIMVIFRLRFRWTVIFAALMFGIEWLFLKLGIYEHEWWRLSYSFVAFIFFFWMVGFWADKVKQGNRFFQYVSLLMFSLSVLNTLAFMRMLVDIGAFQPGFFDNPKQDDVAFTVPYAFLKAVLLANAIYWSRKLRWTLAAVAVMLAVHYMLIRSGILKLYISPWTYWPLYITSCLTGAVLILLAMRLLRRPQVGQ
jgi:hypothetical protein